MADDDGTGLSAELQAQLAQFEGGADGTGATTTASEDLMALAMQLGLLPEGTQNPSTAQSRSIMDAYNATPGVTVPNAADIPFIDQYQRLMRATSTLSSGAQRAIRDQYLTRAANLFTPEDAQALVDELTSDEALAPILENDRSASILQNLVTSARQPIDMDEREFMSRQAAAQASLGPLVSQLVAQVGGPDSQQGKILSQYAEALKWQAAANAPNFAQQRVDATSQIYGSPAGQRALEALSMATDARGTPWTSNGPVRPEQGYVNPRARTTGSPLLQAIRQMVTNPPRVSGPRVPQFGTTTGTTTTTTPWYEGPLDVGPPGTTAPRPWG